MNCWRSLEEIFFDSILRWSGNGNFNKFLHWLEVKLNVGRWISTNFEIFRRFFISAVTERSKIGLNRNFLSILWIFRREFCSKFHNFLIFLMSNILVQNIYQIWIKFSSRHQNHLHKNQKIKSSPSSPKISLNQFLNHFQSLKISTGQKKVKNQKYFL